MASAEICDEEKYAEEIRLFHEIVRSHVSEEYTDEFILRWLKGANFDMEKAEEMFIRYWNLKKLLLINEDLVPEGYEPPKYLVELSDSVITFLGFDKKDAVILYIPLGYIDIDGILKSMPPLMDLMFYAIYYYKNLLQLQMERRNFVGKLSEIYVTPIIDFENFGLHTFESLIARYWKDATFSLPTLREGQDLFPEGVNNIFAINVPGYLEKPYNNVIKPVVRPFVKTAYFEKLYICSQGASEEILLKHIDADVLPAFLGGTRTDENGNPDCSAFIAKGMKIPEEKYNDNMFLQITDPGVLVTVVPAKDVQSIKVKIREPRSKIHLEIFAESIIWFQFSFRKTRKSKNVFLIKDKDTKEIDLIPKMMIEPSVVPIELTVCAPDAGIYIAHLDNTTSWFNAIQVLYRIQIFPPGEKYQACYVNEQNNKWKQS